MTLPYSPAAFVDPKLAAADQSFKKWLGERPIDWSIICGSGFRSALVDGLQLRETITIPLTKLGLPAPSVGGHGGSLIWGVVDDGNKTTSVCIQSGRIHAYEGHPISVCTAALHSMLSAGAKNLLLTCAVGGLQPGLATSQLVSLKDQINLFGPTPLVGPNFVDCSKLYDPGLREQLQRHAAELGHDLPEVIYAHARGPQYETPAEVAALRGLGADVVGMSTTYESILAAFHETRTCGIGIVTNAAGADGLNHAEVQEKAALATLSLRQIVMKLLL